MRIITCLFIVGLMALPATTTSAATAATSPGLGTSGNTSIIVDVIDGAFTGHFVIEDIIDGALVGYIIIHDILDGQVVAEADFIIEDVVDGVLIDDIVITDIIDALFENIIEDLVDGALGPTQGYVIIEDDFMPRGFVIEGDVIDLVVDDDAVLGRVIITDIAMI